MQTIGIAALVLVFFAQWILSVVLGLRATKRKNYSPNWMWLALHPLGGWLVFIVLKFLPGMKDCPHCRERTQASARNCPACGKAFPPETIPEKRPFRVKPGQVAAGIAAALAIMLIGTFSLIEYLFVSSDMYKEAMARAARSGAVSEAIGLPLTGAGFIAGSLHGSGGASGSGDLNIPVRGSRGSGRLYVEAEMHAGQWTLRLLTFEAGATKKRYDLLR
jgi:hypothetical protein